MPSGQPTVSDAVHPGFDARRERVPLRLAERIYPPAVIILPLLGVVAAASRATQEGIHPVSVASFLVCYTLIGLGLALGYHRLISHNAFRTHRVTRYVFAVLGTMSGQGLFFNWIADHRLHHTVTDAPGDPHSPHWRDEEALHGIRGLLHAHVGWMFGPRQAGRDKLIPDLLSDPVMRGIDRFSAAIVIIGLTLPGALVLGFGGGASLAMDAVLWGGGVRMFVLNHTTWCVNSLGHSHGPRHFASRDESRDHPLLAMLAFGDGWHNGHHAFPKSARHGLIRGQLDPAYGVIRMLARVGLAWDVQLPTRDKVAGRLLRADVTQPASGLPAARPH